MYEGSLLHVRALFNVGVSVVGQSPTLAVVVLSCEGHQGDTHENIFKSVTLRSKIEKFVTCLGGSPRGERHHRGCRREAPNVTDAVHSAHMAVWASQTDANGAKRRGIETIKSGDM